MRVTCLHPCSAAQCIRYARCQFPVRSVSAWVEETVLQRSWVLLCTGLTLLPLSSPGNMWLTLEKVRSTLTQLGWKCSVPIHGKSHHLTNKEMLALRGGFELPSEWNALISLWAKHHSQQLISSLPKTSFWEVQDFCNTKKAAVL